MKKSAETLNFACCGGCELYREGRCHLSVHRVLLDGRLVPSEMEPDDFCEHWRPIDYLPPSW